MYWRDKRRREAEKTADVLRFQLENSLQNLSLDIHHLTSLVLLTNRYGQLGVAILSSDEALSNFYLSKNN